jgi:phosphoenolpyruvate phosphomutase
MNKRLVTDNGKRTIITKKNFNQLILENDIVSVCGVHNAIMASLAEDAGFDGVWLSSFEAHASCRLPDADILNVSDYSNMSNSISDRICVPLLVDGDAGGGSPINTIRMVREYEKNGAAGICIEDNKYPKRCSFYGDVKRELEDPRIHALKIKAAIENRIEDDFLIIARTESLIVGNSVEDAIYRANLYADAGAEAILIHHKGETPDLIFEFAKKFKNKLPLVSVPTTYNVVTEQQLVDHGFNMVIYANCGIRAIVKTLQKVFKDIFENKTLSCVNENIVSMSDIFKIVSVEELKFNEKRYSLSTN